MTPGRALKLLFIIALSSTMLAACGNPCTKIAESACAVAGTESEECTRLQKLATTASAEEIRACEVALNLVESLEKVQ